MGWSSGQRQLLWDRNPSISYNTRYSDTKCKNQDVWEALLTIFGSELICRSLIAGASLIGAAIKGGCLGEEGNLGNLMLLWETDCKCRRRRPCIAAGVWAGKAGGSRENSWPLDCSDGQIWFWEFLGVGLCGGLKFSCLFGTEDPSAFFKVVWSLCNFFWSNFEVAGFKVCNAWGFWAG